ncbi:hypothetical protein LJC31_07940 [Synergistaceae bacterium OttesenSCG-928-I11]|nr:hypothetical protein [Synergistaceae bacterium OttesenSCG-928-I11]
MLSLVRSGPTIVTISATAHPNELIKAIENNSFVRNNNPMEAYNNAGEGDTLIFFSAECSDEVSTYQTTLPTSAILCDIINKNLAGGIQRIRVTPPNIVMRLLGDLDRAIDRIAKDFKAQEAIREGLMQNLDEQSVLVNFTTLPLNKLVPIDGFYKRALLIDKPYGQLMTFLRAKAQEYMSIALGSPDWNEIEITLFDAMDQFDLHYNRLITALQGLDIGIVTGESWVPEYTIALRKSEVYQVRFYTPLPPQEIKRVAMGLEYDDQGRRVVDFDVYFNKKKIGWATERASNPGMARDGIGVLHRRRLLSKLPAEAKAVMLNLDKKIDKSGPEKR